MRTRVAHACAHSSSNLKCVLLCFRSTFILTDAMRDGLKPLDCSAHDLGKKVQRERERERKGERRKKREGKREKRKEKKQREEKREREREGRASTH